MGWRVVCVRSVDGPHNIQISNAESGGLLAGLERQDNGQAQQMICSLTLLR